MDLIGGGSSEIIVAVLDTGVAYENYSKYNSNINIVNGQNWEFSKASDVVEKIFINPYEIMGGGDEDPLTKGLGSILFSGLFDEAKDLGPYCIDSNGDRLCDYYSGAIFDDINGFNVIDWYKYWDVSYLDWYYAPYCIDNNPNDEIDFTTFSCVDIDSVKCLNEGYFSDNASYYGCEFSDMGHPNDTNGHGTFVANIIASKSNNGIGGIGIAPNITLMPIKVLGDVWDELNNQWIINGGSTLVNYINGMFYAIDNGAEIINLSLGSNEPSFTGYLSTVVAEMSNVIVVAASGNDGGDVKFPASYSTVLAVGAANVDGTKSSYSSYDYNLDLVAPVEEDGIVNESYQCFFTLDCEPNGQNLNTPSQYIQFANNKMEGTSFAAPQVSAVAALVKTVHPEWTPAQIRFALTMSAIPTDLNNRVTEQTGFGVLNAFNAVRGVDYLGRDLFASYTENVVTNNLIENKVQNGYLYIRSSQNGGETKSAWRKISHTAIRPGSQSFSTIGANGYYDSDSEMYIFIPNEILVTYIGTNNKVYTRLSSDYGLNWSSPVGSGYSQSSIATRSIGSRVIQATKYYGGTYNNHVRTRISDDGGYSWGPWAGPSLSGSMTIADFVNMVYDPKSGNLIQGVRSTSNGLYVRYSTNLGDTWSTWTRMAAAYGTPALILSGGNVYLSMIGYKGKVLTRITDDGGLTWKPWILEGYTYGWIYTVPDTYGGAYQAVKWGDGTVYTRKSVDGSTFSTWLKHSLPNKGKASSGLKFNRVGDNLFLSVVSTDKYVYSKISTDNGQTWGSWQKQFSSSNSYSLTYDFAINRLYQHAKRLDGYLYIRYSDNGGASWSPLIRDSGVKMAVGVWLTPYEKVNVDF